MSEQMNQKISQYLDRDLSRSDTLELFKTMQQDEQVQAKLQRYLIAQQALKAKPVIMADSDFLSKVKQELEHEPVYIQPPKPAQLHHKPALWALAASIVAVAIIVPTWIKTTQTVPLGTMAMVQKSTTADFESSDRVRVYPVNQRFQDYLQAHNGSLYTNGTAKLKAQTHLASYDQE